MTVSNQKSLAEWQVYSTGQIWYGMGISVSDPGIYFTNA